MTVIDINIESMRQAHCIGAKYKMVSVTVA